MTTTKAATKATKATAKSSKSVYEMVTDRIIQELEQGTIPWEKPWSGGFDGAFNRMSKRPYSLINQCMLKHTGEYASFKQWGELGGKIKKGEKAEFVVFWKILPVKEKDEKTGEEETKMIPLLKYYNVFHISQVEGVEPLEKEDREDIKNNPVEEAENVISDYLKRSGVKMERILSNRAFYRPFSDEVVIPHLDQFKEVSEAYSTYFHELTHSTGHKTRLDRFGNNPADNMFGSESYSKEELVAEMGSAFILNHLGIESKKSFRNSSAYIQGWLKALKNDTRLITSAASKAEKAVKLILDIKDEEKETAEN